MEKHEGGNIFEILIDGIWLEILSRITGAISDFIFSFVDAIIPDNDPTN